MMEAVDRHLLGLTDRAIYDNVIGYLQAAGELLDSVDDAAGYVTGIAEAYPDYQGTLYELSAGFIFASS